MANGRKVKAVILADAFRIGKYREQARMLKEAFPGLSIEVVCGPASAGLVPNQSFTEGGTAQMAAYGMCDSEREYTLVMPLGVFPGGRAMRLDGSPFIVYGGRAGQLPGVNVQDGRALHFAYGAAMNWTGCFLLTESEREKFVIEADKPGRQSWMAHEVLNVLIAGGTQFGARKRTIENKKRAGVESPL